MSVIEGRIQHGSGIVLGGLGTGSVEIRPDGYFHDWQIFNLGEWAPPLPIEFRHPGQIPYMPPGALAFFVRSEQEGEAPRVRRLGMRNDLQNLYSLPWLKSVEEIRFDGRYPVAQLSYRDPDLPISVESCMFSPIVPHDARTSGTPGFYVVMKVKNQSERPVRVSLAGSLRNPLAWSSPSRGFIDPGYCDGRGNGYVVPEHINRKLSNSITRLEDTTILTMRTNAELECKATVGSMAFSVSGGEHSFIAGDFTEYIQGTQRWRTAYGSYCWSFLNDFRKRGVLPCTDGSTSPVDLLRYSDDEIEGLDQGTCNRLVGELQRYAFAVAIRDRELDLDPEALRSRESQIEYIKAVKCVMEAFVGAGGTRQPWGDGALCSSFELAPGEERKVRFTLSWFFPHLYASDGSIMGHMYENWFADAEDVSRFLNDRYEEISRKTRAFADSLYDTTLDQELSDAWSGQLSTLVKSSWWIKDGRFAVWEGLGCCGLHTTDITYHGSFSIIALFPELQKRQMQMGAQHQLSDGRVHHLFRGDLQTVDETGYERVDMNQQFIMLVLRDYLWTGDRSYLESLWPNIVKAMDFIKALDGNDDGLPDKNTRLNTYDAWDLRGTPVYIACLTLGAYQAAVRIAKELGHDALAQEWTGLLDKGRRSLETVLWNGEYYSLWVDGDERDECCMSDQLDGEWFARLVGFGSFLPTQRVQDTLKAIIRYNYEADYGLANASYPPGMKPKRATYKNAQVEGTWTGIEYAIASMLIDCGLFEDGLMLVKNIDHRYRRAGMIWNHVECGSHYYRAMSSWATLLAATGFKVDMADRIVTMNPRTGGERFRAPWYSATGWGMMDRADGSFTIACASGELAFDTLRVGVPRSVHGAEGWRVTLDGVELAPAVTLEGNLLILDFAETGGVQTVEHDEKPARLREGQILKIIGLL